MKKTFLPLAMVLAVMISGCGKQQAERMDHVLLELKAAQAESKRLADQMAGLAAEQEQSRKDLAATRTALDEARAKAAGDLADAQAKAAEQRKKLEEQLDEAKKMIADAKAAAAKPPAPAAAQPADAKTNPTAAATGDKPQPATGQPSSDAAARKPDGRKTFKIDFGAGAQPATSSKTTEGKMNVSSPPKSSAPSSGVRSGNYKFIERSSPKTTNADSSPSAVSSPQGKSFVSPMGGIYFRFNSAKGEWTSGKGAVRASGAPGSFVADLERRLKSEGRIPKGASLFLQNDGSIVIEPAAKGGVNPQRVPDPKELSPQRVPDPKELGNTASPPDSNAVGGGSPPPPTKVQ